jgi:hypothetical protein
MDAADARTATRREGRQPQATFDTPALLYPGRPGSTASEAKAGTCHTARRSATAAGWRSGVPQQYERLDGFLHRSRVALAPRSLHRDLARVRRASASRQKAGLRDHAIERSLARDVAASRFQQVGPDVPQVSLTRLRDTLALPLGYRSLANVEEPRCSGRSPQAFNDPHRLFIGDGNRSINAHRQTLAQQQRFAYVTTARLA